MTDHPIMLNEKEVGALLDRALMIRAGSVFSTDFEMGQVCAFLQVLGYNEEATMFAKVYGGNRKRQITNMRKIKQLWDNMRERFNIPEKEKPSRGGN